MSTIKAPFTEEQVEALNNYQQESGFHPFTCLHNLHNECGRSNKDEEGVLIASKEGWICPCGKWRQDWAHDFMAQKP